ncbi:unnamed protein product, partial [Mesorhabditis belari]|uniref:Uncharacterized protein n=1 Tax=Mesorhabditis belari TaxID=2138241 RepID=A0AAF3EW14_9BILA
MKSIVLPTILFCIGMVVAMLIGINKCKQWELDKVVEMRRTRRVVQRITERLREKNFNTIQKARDARRARKLAAAAAKRQAQETNLIDNNNKTETTPPAPPLYSEGGAQSCGTSPPPSYEDAILDEFYEECMPDQMRSTIRRSSTHSRTSHHSVRSQRARQRRKSTTGHRQKEFIV